jgi:hypothetical protein
MITDRQAKRIDRILRAQRPIDASNTATHRPADGAAIVICVSDCQRSHSPVTAEFLENCTASATACR